MRFYFVFVLIFAGLPAFTQNKNVFKGGIILGLNTSQINGDGYSGFDKAGIVGGFILKTKLSDKVTFQGELTYITKGSYDPPNYLIGKYTLKRIKLSYIEIPLIFKYQFKKVNFNAGASFGILTSQKQYDINGLLPAPFIGPFKKTEIATLIGVDYNLTDRWAVCWQSSVSILPIANRVVFDKLFLGLFGGAYNQYMSVTFQYTFKSKSNTGE